MDTPSDKERAGDVERILRTMFEHGWEGFDVLESWDGQDLEALRPYLDEAEFQTLMAELAALDDERGR